MMVNFLACDWLLVFDSQEDYTAAGHGFGTLNVSYNSHGANDGNPPYPGDSVKKASTRSPDYEQFFLKTNPC